MAKRINDEKIIKIYEYTREHSMREASKKFGVSMATVQRINNRKTISRYKKIIDMYLKKDKTPESKTEIKTIKTIKRLKLDDEETEEVNIDNKEKIKNKIKMMDEEILIADILAILENYFTPIVLKLVYDNIFQDEHFKKLIKNTAEQIKLNDDPDLYIEAVKTLFLGILLQLLKEDQISKILK